MMTLDEKAEELLETLWISHEEKRQAPLLLDNLEADEKELIKQLEGADYVALTDEGSVRLTDRGQPVARNVVRRHRLAERLLADVLGTSDKLMHEKACKFEHLLDRGLDESICSLLGHPKICPHGKPIPPGSCCREKQAPGQKIVSPLSQLSHGQKGKVAYIYAPESKQLQKLMAMGILPESPITLFRSFPSYVFQVGQAQFAVDKEIADAIYVRLIESEPSGIPNKKQPNNRGWRHRFGHFGRGRSN